MNLLKSTGFRLKSLYLRPFQCLNVRGDFRIFSNLLVSSQAFAGNFGKNVGKNQGFTNGLSAGYPQELFLGVIELNVGIGVQRHADVARHMFFCGSYYSCPIQIFFEFHSFDQHPVSVHYIEISIGMGVNDRPKLALADVVIPGGFLDGQRVSAPYGDMWVFLIRSVIHISSCSYTRKAPAFDIKMDPP